MTLENEEDRVQAFLAELDQLCERHGLWLDTGGLDDLVRVSQQRLGPYFGSRIDEGHPILCSLPLEGVMDSNKENRDMIVAIRGGRPAIRGMRITVGDVLGWLASGMSEAEILDDYPELTEADIRVALAFAAGLEHKGRLLDPLSGAAGRSIAHRCTLAELAGELLSSSQVEDLLGIKRLAIDKRRSANKLLAVRLASDWLYPAFQFGESGVLPGIEEVLQVHASDDPWVVMDILLAPDDALRGRSLLQAIQEGDDAAISRHIAQVLICTQN